MTSLTNRLSFAALCSVGLLGLAACQTDAPKISKEDLLSSAGFKMKVADTPAKMASLKQLPPLKFVHKNLNGKLMTLYADPAGCKCLFVGGPTAWQNYVQATRINAVALSTEEQAEMSNQTVIMNEEASMGPWGWEPWGLNADYGP